MAGITVIDQQQDPAAKMIAEAGTSIRDTIQKEQAMALTARYYGILAKNAQTEQEKVEYQRKADFTKALIDIKDNFGNNPSAAAIALKAQMEGQHSGDYNQGFKDMHEVATKSDEYYQQLAGKIQNSSGEATSGELRGSQTALAASQTQKNQSEMGVGPAQAGLMGAQTQEASSRLGLAPAQAGLASAQAQEASSRVPLGAAQAQLAQAQAQGATAQIPGYAAQAGLYGAQASNQAAEAAMNQARASAMQDPAGYFAKMSAGMRDMAGGQPGGQPGQEQPQDPNNPIAQGPVWTGGTVNTPLGDMSYSNPAADAAKAQATTIGNTIGTQQVELTPLKAAISNYRELLTKGNQEVGGTSATMAGARLKSIMSHATSGFRKDSVLPALDQQATQIADTLSTYINKGRSAEYKIKISKDIIPYVDDSKATQDYLNKNLDAMLKIGATGNPHTQADDTLSQHASRAAEVVAKDRKFADALRRQGIGEAEINQRINAQHKRLGL